jgi:predicted O-methyltransferase YrrM
LRRSAPEKIAAMMPLPRALRRAVPDRVRDDVRLRAAAVGLGLIPPRSMHSPAESALLARLATRARRVVEIGVYEAASAAVLCAALDADAELHLIDPFGHHATALPRGWGATEWASRRVVARASRRPGAGAPRVVWHVELSEQTAAAWSAPVDLVFIDGDHSEQACQLDWDAWHRFVTPGGHVLFHDARAGEPEGRGLPGPTAVVSRTFRGECGLPGWEIVTEVDRTVAVRRSAGEGAD